MAGFIPVMVTVIIVGAYLGLTPATPPTTVSATSNSTTTIITPDCSAPCAVWTKPSGSNPEALAISPDDSFVAVGNDQTLQVFNAQGNELWSYNTSHVISSISISSNDQYIAVGGWQIEGGPGTAAAYTNGEVYLFNAASGKLLWSKDTGSSNPVWKVVLSSDGSKLSVDTENSIMYLGGAEGNTIWSYSTGGNVVGMDMSADGTLVVASMGPIVAFNDQGTILWSHPAMTLAVSVNSVAVSSDGSYVWVGSAVDGYNGSLYLFNKQGVALWQKQIYSPALSIQTGDNLTTFVSTNWGALLYGADGSLLKNITSSAIASIPSGCSPLPNFWYWSGELAPVAFIDSEGSVISSYNPGGYTNNAALSSDRQYALVASSNEGSGFSLAFVFLGNPNYQTCEHT